MWKFSRLKKNKKDFIKRNIFYEKYYSFID